MENLQEMKESGRKLFNEQKYSEAIEYFTKIIEAEANALHYYQRATTFGCLLDRKKAIADYSKVIELDETFVDAYLYRGMNLFKIEDFKKAESDFSKVIEFGGTDFSFLYRGISRIRNGKEKEAIDDLNVFIEKEPNHVQALFHRGLTNRILDNLSNAISDLTRVLELSNETDELYQVSLEKRGKFYVLYGEFAKGIEDLTSLLKLDSNNVHALYYRGMAFQNSNQNENAVKDHARVKELDSENQHSYHETLILPNLEKENEEQVENEEISENNQDKENANKETPTENDDNSEESNESKDETTPEHHEQVSSQPIEDNPIELANKHEED